MIVPHGPIYQWMVGIMSTCSISSVPLSHEGFKKALSEEGVVVFIFILFKVSGTKTLRFR